MHTLSQLIEQSGAQYRIFDMGRAIRKVDRETFEKFEAAQQPYPYPFQGHAWFALLFWSPQQKEEHQIWFIKFPLDEQGLLKQACRDDFIKRTIDEIAQRKAEKPQETPAASDNPWGFTPHQDKMAAIHAKSSVAMGLGASQFYQPARAYLQAPSADWQSLGIQGIADFCARINEDNNETILINALPQLTPPVLAHILPLLENEEISHRLADAIVALNQCSQGNGSQDPNLMSASVRALSQAKGSQLKTFVEYCLQSPFQTNVEILVAISGRAWDVLNDETLALQFLERLARNDAGQPGFNHIIKDILYLPEVGPVVRNAFKSEQRSDVLTNCLGAFLKNVH